MPVVSLKQTALDRRPKMVAKYDSKCPECRDEILANVDTIIKDRGLWVHEDCAVTE